MNSQSEAITILHEVIKGLTSPTYDLISIMRRCQHVCELLQWQPTKTWFHQELNGYYPNTPLPPYRRIPGVKKWTFEGSMYKGIEYEAEAAIHRLDSNVYTEEPDTLEVTAGIGWFLNTIKTGYSDNLLETKKAKSPSGQGQITLRRVRSFPAGNIGYSLSQLVKTVFDWASSSYTQLQYGNRIQDIWDKHRIKVDSAIQQLGLTEHLSAIQDGISKDNRESWRAAVFECRNLLNDLANSLWRDSKDTYIYLSGSGPDGKLDVRHGYFANRLKAYLHQKSVGGTKGKFLRDEAERLSISIRNLISVESAAHEPIESSLAEMVVLSTYFVIGEFALRTDLSPVTEYTPPST